MTNAFTKISLDLEKNTRQTMPWQLLQKRSGMCLAIICLWSFSWFSKEIWYSKSQNTFFKIRVLWYLGYPTWPYQIWPNQQKTLYTHKWCWFKHFKQHTWHSTRLSSWATLIPNIYINDMSRVIQKSITSQMTETFYTQVVLWRI